MTKKNDDDTGLNRMLTVEIARVTESAAIAAARLRGCGDEIAADQAAVDAMWKELNRLPIRGRIVIGEGEHDEASMLYIGEEVGLDEGPEIGIKDIDQKYTLDDLATGDLLFAATGVTSGSMLLGVHVSGGTTRTETVVMRAKTRTVRWIKTEHGTGRDQ